jgi:TonB family protein
MSKQITVYTASFIGRSWIELPALLLFTMVIITTSACELHNEGARQKLASRIAAEAIESSSGLGPASFEYVQLLDRNHWLVVDSDQVWQTEDSGRTWTISYGIKTDGSRGKHIKCLSFINSTTGFLIVDGLLLRTDDKGGHWSKVGKLDFGVHNCCFIDTLQGWAVGSAWQEGYREDPNVPMYAGRIWATKDGGRTWQQQRIDLPRGYFEDGARWGLHDVFFTNQRIGWVVGEGIIFRTEDGGENWHVADNARGEYGQVRFLNEWFGWATALRWPELSITTDGGRHWRLLDGPPAHVLWPLKVVFVNSGHGFAALLDLYETKDGGYSWEQVTKKGESGIHSYEYVGRAQDGTLIVLGLKEDKTVVSLVSTDDGVTWQSNNEVNDKLVTRSAKDGRSLSFATIRKSEEELLKLAVDKADPLYPAIAGAAQATGDVIVEVIIDEEGDVISARALSGHPLLRDAAVEAAQKWKFRKTMNRGKAVKVVGTLTFKFNP